MPWTIIDGYNLLLREDLAVDSLERAREAFLRTVDAVRLPSEKVIVVFDGRSGPITRVPSMEGLEVTFSRGAKDADEEILSRVESLPKGQVTVLTYDRELARRVRRAGGLLGDPKRFFRLPEFRSGPLPSEKPPPPTAAEIEDWERLFGEGPPED